MPCDTRMRWRGQTISQRAEEVREVTNKVQAAILQDKIKIVISPQGAVTFRGLSIEDRLDVTDACVYRRIMSTGGQAVKAAFLKAEMMSGRKIDRNTVNAGQHSHDGGSTWHNGH